MDKHLLFIFSYFCFIVAVTPIRCVTCHFQTQADHCRRDFEICTTKRNEKCLTLRISQGGTLLLSYMVCQKFCKNLSYNFKNRTYVHKCCNKDYCNYPF
ncbi:prostate and testis expressed protein 3 isoform X3 [Sorex araneus]|uniref:prostate and testis expressed protein 3 isoform X3 n=1 Tax=Sorex araneus TaxID=42254 RepID=UPI00033164C3|nr:prostate and testis expressed protein 3 isoform X3 [Sorex araneus]